MGTLEHMFKLTKKSAISQARSGVLTTGHGQILTPFFMPIATRASVKTLTTLEIKELGSQILLANSYHLYLKPGLKVIKKAGGLHGLMNWPGIILTDSGGFQVFSLSAEDRPLNQKSGGLVKVTDKGVEFRSVYDGSKHFFTPASVIKMQQIFGSDIMMVLDQCIENPSTKEKAREAVERTLLWAKQSIKYQESRTKEGKSSKSKVSKSLLFGIVQGSLFKDLRIRCAQELVKMSENFSATCQRQSVLWRKGGSASG
jgi:queuine tRNA-ribosyltransferase